MAEASTSTPATRTNTPLSKAGFIFIPETWEQLHSYAKMIAETDFVPSSMRGKPGAVLAAWQKGAEVGLSPMASLEGIAIINGRPSIHSSAYWSLIISNPLCESFDEDPPDVALKQGFGRCTIKRRGNPTPVTRQFSIEDAKRADLINKDNYKKYLGTMLMHRARHACGEAAIPEACQGLIPSDIAQDLEPRDVTPPATRSAEMPLPQPTDEGDGVPERKEPADDQPPPIPTAPQTVEERRAWIAHASLEDVTAANCLALQNMKKLTQAEQAAVCSAHNDRKQALLKEAQQKEAGE